MVELPDAQASIPPGAAESRVPVVLQVVQALNRTLAGRTAVDHAIAVARAGGRSVVAAASGALAHELERAGIAALPLSLESDGAFAWRAAVRRLRQIVEETGPDIVHAHGRLAASCAAAALQGHPARLAATFHETLQSAGLLARRRLAAMARTDQIIAPSRFVAHHAMRELNLAESRIEIVPPGLNLAHFDPQAVSPERIIQLARQWRLPDDRRIVLLPGRLDPDRGQVALIEAVAALRRHDILCLLVGAEPEDAGRRAELERLIAKRRLGGLVQIADRCLDMGAAYMLADAVVVADHRPTAFSRVAVEAQAMGRPVIATAAGGIPESLVPGETGWIVPVNNIQALAGAVHEALSLTATERAGLAAVAAAHARERHDLALMNERILGLYDTLLESRAAAGRT